MLSFNIEQAKKQVDAVPKLALPYFLDACDEIEKLREQVSGINIVVDGLLAENEKLADKVEGRKNRMGGVTTP
jgi:hypothetical protein